MGDKKLKGRDRDLYERLRAKGIGRKLARRIAGAPDVDGDAGASKRARKAAKKAARRLTRDSGGSAAVEHVGTPEPVQLPAAPERPSLPAAGDTTGGISPTEGPLRAAVEAAGVEPRAGTRPSGDEAAAPAPRAAWRRRTGAGGRAPALRSSTGGGRGARRRRRAGGRG